MSKKIMKSLNRFVLFLSSLFGLNTESNLFFLFHVFHWKNSTTFWNRRQITVIIPGHALIQSRNNWLAVLIRTTNLIGRSYFVTVLCVSWKYKYNPNNAFPPSQSWQPRLWAQWQYNFLHQWNRTYSESKCWYDNFSPVKRTVRLNDMRAFSVLVCVNIKHV